jgi:hypothetical protein
MPFHLHLPELWAIPTIATATERAEAKRAFVASLETALDSLRHVDAHGIQAHTANARLLKQAWNRKFIEHFELYRFN